MAQILLAGRGKVRMSTLSWGQVFVAQYKTDRLLLRQHLDFVSPEEVSAAHSPLKVQAHAVSQHTSCYKSLNLLDLLNRKSRGLTDATQVSDYHVAKFPEKERDHREGLSSNQSIIFHVHPEQTARDAMLIMLRNRIGAVLVVNPESRLGTETARRRALAAEIAMLETSGQGRWPSVLETRGTFERCDYLGIFTTRDFLRKTVFKKLCYNKIKVESVMQRVLPTMEYTQEASDVVQELYRIRQRHVVVTDGHAILGVLAASDLVTQMNKDFVEASQYLTEYVKNQMAEAPGMPV
eukprot:gb/GEZN01008282.1/.p1 GENE.gb/GEZN01008282.1/~~gb/GEZN01008282.1/.p1  ORF type:complete len:294 (-),score=27.44 gb/GEZN01008282.1/:395-1276(-)